MAQAPRSLPATARELVDRPVIASFTTLRADGSPHTTPVWIGRDGDWLLVNTASGRVKTRNVIRDPRVALCLVDPLDPLNVVALEGTVVEVTRDGADEMIDELNLKYTGNPSFRCPRAWSRAAHTADPHGPSAAAARLTGDQVAALHVVANVVTRRRMVSLTPREGAP